jgi:hypothetical protein
VQSSYHVVAEAILEKFPFFDRMERLMGDSPIASTRAVANSMTDLNLSVLLGQATTEEEPIDADINPNGGAHDETGSHRGLPGLDETPPTGAADAGLSPSTTTPVAAPSSGVKASASTKAANTKARKGGSAVLEQVESMITHSGQAQAAVATEKSRNKVVMQRELLSHQTAEREAAEREAARRREHEERMLEK